jgi:ribosomal RNA assembly protein
MSFERIVKIPKDRVAVLIGKKGKIKFEIENKCNVRINIDSESGDIIILSKAKHLFEIESLKAIEIVSAISKGFSPQRAYKLLEEEVILQIIDLKDFAGKSLNSMERIKGRIIGAKGKSRKTIEELSGAYISVYGHSVGIIGKFEEIKLAVNAITMIAKGSAHKSVYSFMQNARRKAKINKMLLWENEIH